jgi:hypothetical protein
VLKQGRAAVPRHDPGQPKADARPILLEWLPTAALWQSRNECFAS